MPDSLVLVRELVNTRDVETGEDALAEGAGFADFVRRHGLGPMGLDRDRHGADLRELRECLRAACLAHAGTDMPPHEAAVLGERLGHAPLALGVDRTGAAALRPAEGLSGMRALTARIAADIAAASADGAWQRLKVCEAHDCLWAFYDRSPAGRRRWCDMAVCGSRAKMRAYRNRANKADKPRDTRS
ncbi:CGNR zinc finger domain-containing protein [Streptomyces sp. ODS28]|uniref:CGNR zinc finger domain-containing protein n=1 Tax=Streptomyces sp. ODS28 TaxID=3136688 RepID=UPI0031F0E4D4